MKNKDFLNNKSGDEIENFIATFKYKSIFDYNSSSGPREALPVL